MVELSEKAIAVLKRIHEDGMMVLHSFRVRTPYYGRSMDIDNDDSVDMPSEDWVFCQDELFSIESKWITPPSIAKEKTLIRRYIKEGIETVDTIMFNDEEEILVDQVMKFPMVGNPDSPYELIDETVHINWQHFERVRVDEFKSDYLTVESIKMSDIFEEDTGILERYVLTETALQLIGEMAGADN